MAAATKAERFYPVTPQFPSSVYTNRNVYICPTKDIHENVYNDAMHNSQNLENVQLQ